MHLQYTPELVAQFWSLVDWQGPDDCWLWRGTVGANTYGRFKDHLAHRLAYSLVHGPIPAGLFVLHSCDTPLCVNPAHLRAGTPKDNTADMLARGRSIRGSRKPSEQRRRGEVHHSARLDSAKVRDIRSAYASGDAHLAILAVRYGISIAAVHNVVRRKTWKHVA